MRTFFTADTHFGHGRAITLNSRPFADVHDMNRSLVERWNTVVRPDDEVWHLGDFAYRSTDAEAEGIFHRLQGRKHLVRGNHDSMFVQTLPWGSVTDLHDLVVDSQRLVLCHYPLAEWKGFHRGAIHLYGHVHGNDPYTDPALPQSDLFGLVRGVGRSCDVGVDVWSYRPVTLAEILPLFKDAS